MDVQNRPYPALRTGETVPGIKKIAVLRANGLGDFIFSLPAFAALRLCG